MNIGRVMNMLFLERHFPTSILYTNWAYLSLRAIFLLLRVRISSKQELDDLSQNDLVLVLITQLRTCSLIALKYFMAALCRQHLHFCYSSLFLTLLYMVFKKRQASSQHAAVIYFHSFCTIVAEQKRHGHNKHLAGGPPRWEERRPSPVFQWDKCMMRSCWKNQRERERAKPFLLPSNNGMLVRRNLRALALLLTILLLRIRQQRML